MKCCPENLLFSKIFIKFYARIILLQVKNNTFFNKEIEKKLIKNANEKNFERRTDKLTIFKYGFIK